MDALDALHGRNSVASLCEPGPDADQLHNIFKAGLRASDHRRLQPWRFIVVQGHARQALGQLMVEVSLEQQPDLSCEQQEKIRAMPLRAPLIVVVVAAVKPEARHKVPVVEQLLSAGAAAQLMTVAAHAQGIGTIWRTGDLAYNSSFKAGLGLASKDEIVGLLYMGTPKSVKPLRQVSVADFVVHWRN